MKTFLTIVAVALMSGLAGAADFAGLQGINAAGIPKVNPFPNPGNPDSCYLTGLKDGLCNFKCRSGETFSVKPVKPEAQSVYEKCGGGDYRGANKAAPKAQTYESYGRYPSFEKASSALNWALNDLKLAKIQVTSQKIVVFGLSDYRYEISFNAPRTLAIEPSPSYRNELNTYELMFEAAARLESRGATVVFQEVRQDGYDSYSFSIGYFPGSSDKNAVAVKEAKKTACFISGMQGNTCIYKCTNGTTYTMPAQRPSPADEFQVACPQFVFPF